jgi:hypothetical protein
VALNAWTRALGETQGRVPLPEGERIEGEYAFALGAAEAGLFQTLNIGDHVEVSQTADLTGLKLLRAVARLRPPSVVPAGTAWRYSLRVDGVERAAQVLVPGRPRRRADLAANVAYLAPGNHTIAFRLELVSA